MTHAYETNPIGCRCVGLGYRIQHFTESCLYLPPSHGHQNIRILQRIHGHVDSCMHILMLAMCFLALYLQYFLFGPAAGWVVTVTCHQYCNCSSYRASAIIILHKEIPRFGGSPGGSMSKLSGLTSLEYKGRTTAGTTPDPCIPTCPKKSSSS
jgi:hypothetical protein